MPIVTVSGSAGSYAIETGRRVASKLKLNYVDRQILTEAARALGVSEERVVNRDERTLHFGERLAALLNNFLERSAAAGATDPLMGPSGLEMLMSTTYGEAAALPPHGGEVSDARYKEAITEIVLGLARKGDVVIIGRGSQAILKDRPDCLHIAVTAPFEVRVARVAERDSISLDEARRRVHESDRGRYDYHRKYFKVDPLDAALYDLTVNTLHLTAEQAAQLVVSAYKRRFSA